MTEIVAHPETGRPAVVETSYRELELDHERNKLSDLQAQLTSAAQVLADHDAQRQSLADNHAALESAVGDQKSLVERAEALQPDGADAGAAGASDSVEAQDEAGDSNESADQSGAAEGDGAAQVIPVQVETADEY